MGKEPEKRTKIKFYKKKSFNKQRSEKYKRKYYNKPSPKKRRFFTKAAYYRHEKTISNVGHVEK